MHKVLVNRLGGLSLPRKSVVRLTDRPDMTLDVYRGRKTTIQQYCFNGGGLRPTREYEVCLRWQNLYTTTTTMAIIQIAKKCSM